MAVGIQNFQNVDTTDPTNYPNGSLKNDPVGSVGTPLNKETLNDIFMFHDKLLRMAGITATGDPESETGGYQYIDAFLLLAGGAPWVDEGTNTGMVTNTGTGTVTVQAGDVLYNRWKWNGSTLNWQLRIRGASITGTVTTIVLPLPASLVSSLASEQLQNAATTGGFQIRGIYNGSDNLIVTFGGLFGPSSQRAFELSIVGGGNFTAGTNDQNFDINIVAELS